VSQILIWAFGIFIVWIIIQLAENMDKKISKSVREPNSEIDLDVKLSRTQLNFEERLDKNLDLPDGITGREAYIYRNLMARWFASLIAQSRYNENMARKLRTDWVNYLLLIESASTSSFLSLHASTDLKCQQYEKEFENEKYIITGIEDAFAAQMGGKASVTLQNIRNLDLSRFDRSGRNLAPDGYFYFPISFNPYIDVLRPKEKDLTTDKLLE